jgi:CheY-like chemotaxis protein
MSQNSAPTPGWRILVVDDRVQFVNGVRDMAVLIDCDVKAAFSLKTAAEELTNEKLAHWTPHLILLDLHLPSRGWKPHAVLRDQYDPTLYALAFCRQVRAHPRLKNVVVCIVTVDDQQEQREMARQAGAHAFYLKDGFHYDTLETLLAHLEAMHSPS